MAPSAFHRIVYAGENAPDFHVLGSRFLLAASAMLALGISADLGVVRAKVIDSETGGIIASGIFLIVLVMLCHVCPARTPAAGTNASLRRWDAIGSDRAALTVRHLKAPSGTCLQGDGGIWSAHIRVRSPPPANQRG